MNLNNMMYQFINKTSRVYSKHNQYTRSLWHFKATMVTDVSISPSQSEKQSFQDVLPILVNTITTKGKFAQVPDVGNWIKKVLDYNLTGGKLNRGLATVIAYKMLEKPQNLTDESLNNARIMGWCVEMMQAYLLVLDDIIDESSTRRGVPCWYRLPEVGLGAINDSILINCFIHQTLKAHFYGKPYYQNVFDLFNDVLLWTSMGQHLDYMMAHRNKNDYSLFTHECYNNIVIHKTAYYTFKLPVSLGLYLTNNTDPVAHAKAEDICLDIGQLFQMQDDFIDCYSDESVSGKAGTDIQEGKCSWLAVTALQRCSSAQRVVFNTCYGSKQPAHIERIKQLYRQLEIEKAYREEEVNAIAKVTEKIHALPETLCPPLFFKLIEMINKRKA